MAMIRHSSRMDRPARVHTHHPSGSLFIPPGFERIFILTVQHVRLGVGETQPAGLQQVGRSDARFGNGDATQTKHL